MSWIKRCLEDILEMHYSGKSYKEISEATGIPEERVVGAILEYANIDDYFG